jgi:DNA-directed RNA polymerase sigma subunit (sigma70/sigma32)
MKDEKWIRVRVKMLKSGVTFQSVADKFGISRQRVQAIVKHGYPARPRAKRILDEFYKKIA